jgi:hypothetical protein
MMAAQENKVIETRLAAIAPVVDMVRIHEARFATAGKATALVAQGQCAANGGWDCADFAAHVQHLARAIFQHRDERGITGEVSSGRPCQPEMTVIAFQRAVCSVGSRTFPRKRVPPDSLRRERSPRICRLCRPASHRRRAPSSRGLPSSTVRRHVSGPVALGLPLCLC